MSNSYVNLALSLKEALHQAVSVAISGTDSEQKNQEDAVFTLTNQNGEPVHLHLTPPQCKTRAADAAPFFSHVSDVSQLLEAYQDAMAARSFETNLFSQGYLSKHAKAFLAKILAQAKDRITADDARLIAGFARDLDIYTAVKAVESLLYNVADLALLRVAKALDWQLHFDHLAIRCGSQSRRAAEKVVELLVNEHGYAPPQIASEAYYQFPDGWNAYPLYKMLENGQLLRLFIDQSDANAPRQIIQHWNYVYGFTAHHLGIRATTIKQGERQALSLSDLEAALAPQGVSLMTATGLYTQGLLQQVFTRPEREDQLPDAVLRVVKDIDPDLVKVIGNAKLLELVSRREMPTALKAAYFDLYGLTYRPDNPLHSAAIYQYFLPAQAAHVIKTSVQTGG